MSSEELAVGFDGGQVSLSHVPVRVEHVPLKLPFNVRDEIVRLADAHFLPDCVRSRTLSRMEVKSSRVSGLAGFSAASNNQASNSGVSSNGFCCWSRTERRRSLTNSLASVQTPERTCSRR